MWTFVILVQLWRSVTDHDIMPHEYVNAQITYALIAFVRFMLFKLIFSVFCSLIVIIIIIINLTNYSLLQNEIQQKKEQKLICLDTYLWSVKLKHFNTWIMYHSHGILCHVSLSFIKCILEYGEQCSVKFVSRLLELWCI
jgi:hypothetical protein